jgi:hypothetical protein
MSEPDIPPRHLERIRQLREADMAIIGIAAWRPKLWAGFRRGRMSSTSPITSITWAARLGGGHAGGEASAE